ncbi:MAG: PaaI family thioesterase [Deltaproteobacteria bacterium]|nr:PaaI family thioesterase [Deltaproteobacteria bacterium]
MSTALSSPAAVLEAVAQGDLAALRRALEESPLARHLGITFTELEPGRAAATLPGGPGLPNFLGYAHTGALFALAEQVMAAAANSLGYVGLPLSCEMHFLNAANPAHAVAARAHVVDTQGRIARVLVELAQGDLPVARLTEMVFLRSGAKA